MRAVAVVGPNGQLGSDLVRGFGDAGWQVLQASHDLLNVEDPKSVDSWFAANPVRAIVNTAAFHQVALCEQDPARSWAVNAGGARNIAEKADSIGATVVYVSTDYVFDGTLDEGHSYPEDYAVSPLNVYGASKAAGEIATLSTSPSNLVVRISSVFGAAGSSGKGGNFVETIVKKARAGDSLAVVDDNWMSPSYTPDVTAKILALLQAGANGVFHANNAGRITWNEFATEICRQIGADVTVEKTTSKADSIPRRPRNSSLATTKAESLAAPQRSWDEALNAYLREKGHLV